MRKADESSVGAARRASAECQIPARIVRCLQMLKARKDKII
jgi:hypothetical protein